MSPHNKKTRSGQVLEIVHTTLARYAQALDSDVDLRSVVIDVKLTKDGRGVRAAVVSLVGEVPYERDDS